MRIAGYVPSSLIDFPGHVAAVVFSAGCTLRCPWCHNPALVLDAQTQNIRQTDYLAVDTPKLDTLLSDVRAANTAETDAHIQNIRLTDYLAMDTNTADAPKLDARLQNLHCKNISLTDFLTMGTPVPAEMDARLPSALRAPSDFYAFLEQRRGLLGGVAVSGGEPCIQEGLIEFLREIRAMGFHTKIDTNGTRPKILAALLGEKLVDVAALDIKAPRDRYAELCGLHESMLPWAEIQESIALIAGAESAREPDGFRHMYRTTCMEPHFDTDAILRMRGLAPAGVPWHLQPYRGGNTLDPDFIAHPPSQETLSEWQRLIDAR